MRKIALLTLTFFLFNLVARTQNGTIKGIVKDSLTGVVLESATVSIFKKIRRW